MLKLTPAKLLLSLTLVAVSFSPLLFAGSGMMIALPVLQIFWLAGLVQALGA